MHFLLVMLILNQDLTRTHIKLEDFDLKLERDEDGGDAKKGDDQFACFASSSLRNLLGFHMQDKWL